MESARQRRAICYQLTLELPTEESGRCVHLGPAPLFTVKAADGLDPRSREFPRDVDAVRDADRAVSCDPPTVDEIRRAVNQMKRKPGGCGIYAELLIAGGAAALLWVHTLLCSNRNTGIIPTDWRRGVGVPI